MRTIRALGLALALAAAACGGGDQATARPRSPATVSIAEPAVGAVVTEERFTVRIALDDGTVVDEVSMDLEPTSEGHIHVSIDGRTVSEIYGLTQEIETPGSGDHLLQVEFVAKDHRPFDPRVIASAPFEVMR